MGDRAVVGFRKSAESPTIYLYSHWGGEDQLPKLQDALLSARSRWSDPDYATRICVSQIVGEYWHHETGFGLSVDSYCTPDYDFIYVVEWSTQRVYKADAMTRAVISHQPFETFVLEGALL